MTQEIELFLESDGFYAGKKNRDGKLGKGAHKITEDEIFTMATTLVRAFAAKTGKDTLVIQGDDGRAVIAKLVEIKAASEQEQDGAGSGPAEREQAQPQVKAQDAPEEQPAAVVPMRKRSKKAGKA